MDRAAALLAGAATPLIIAGGGVNNGRYYEEVFALALYAGQVGPRGSAVAPALARESDVFLALGTRLGLNTTFYSCDNLHRAARIVQVEIDPTAIGRFFPAEVGIVGDAGLVATGLAHALTSDKAGRALAWTHVLLNVNREDQGQRAAQALRGIIGTP